MNDEMDFDLGPLTWVKGELDNALQAAQQSLAGWNGEDAAPLQSAAAHLHQVYGALQIVDLQGVALLTIETEHLLSNQANNPARRSKQAIDAATQSIVQIQAYLDALMKGEPQTEMKLAPIYEEVLSRGGVDKPAPSELFYPDTLARAQRGEPELPLDDEARTRAIRKARLQYQKGLLQFLQNRSPVAGLTMMDEAVRSVERLAPGPAQYT
jgi:chemosensory pili system protein ChpA (sensor histidine kinase/response regulator)